MIGIEDSIKGTPKCSINPPKQEVCVAIYVSLYQMVNKLSKLTRKRLIVHLLKYQNNNLVGQGCTIRLCDKVVDFFAQVGDLSQKLC